MLTDSIEFGISCSCSAISQEEKAQIRPLLITTMVDEPNRVVSYLSLVVVGTKRLIKLGKEK